MRLTDLRASPMAVRKATLNRGIFRGSALTDKRMFDWWMAFQDEAAQVGIPLRVVWGHRTHAEQARLHKQGYGTRPGNSSHEAGYGLDIIHTTRAWNNMPNEGWRILIGMGKEVARKQNFAVESGGNVKWGGDWLKQNDAAHWNIANWRNETFQPR